MALRISESIVKGEIDNRVLGRVSGSIHLLGRNDPIRLELSGNCWPDLAGCSLRFENPFPKLVEDEPSDIIFTKQVGIAGDITASRKVRVFDVALEKALAMAREGGSPPEHLANSLYIEWFSDANGRVVIETANYQLSISQRTWQMSAEEAKRQIQRSAQAMRDWFQRLGKALEEQQEESE